MTAPLRIGFAASDWGQLPDGTITPGGTAWLRCLLIARALRDHGGHETFVGQDIAAHNRTGELMLVERDTLDPRRATTEEWHHGLDVIVITRWMEAEAPRVIRRARANGQVVINDLDDWYHGMAPSNRAWWTTHPKASADRNRNHYMEVLRASSAITVSTPYLVDRYREHVNDAVPMFVLRNAIDLDRFAGPAPAPHDPPRIGWAGHVSFRHHDLETLRGVIGPWAQRNGWGVHHAGDDPRTGVSARDLLGVPDGVPWTTSGLAPLAEYPGILRDLDVGLVPLSDAPFNLAKSAIKGMEYAAVGLPFVARATPEYEWLAEQGIGRTARKPRQWLRHLDELADPDVRAAEGAANRAALAPLDIGARWREWDDAYRQVHALVA